MPVITKYGDGLKIINGVLSVDLSNSDLIGFVPNTLTLTAGSGLIGGGTLSTDRSFAIDFGATSPTALGSATAGITNKASRSDHVHPTTGLAVLASANTFAQSCTFSEGITIASNKKINAIGKITLAIGGTDKIRVIDGSLLLGHTIAPNESNISAFVVKNSSDGGVYGALNGSNEVVGLLSIDENNNVTISDSSLQSLYLKCGNVMQLSRASVTLVELDDGSETTEQTSLKIRINSGGVKSLKRVFLSNSASSVPTGAYVLYVIP